MVTKLRHFWREQENNFCNNSYKTLRFGCIFIILKITKIFNRKITIRHQNTYLYYLIDPSFHRVNNLFVLSFENNDDRTGNRMFFPK